MNFVPWIHALSPCKCLVDSNFNFIQSPLCIPCFFRNSLNYCIRERLWTLEIFLLGKKITFQEDSTQVNQTFVLMSSDGINTEHFDGCENEKEDPLSS